MNRKIGEYLGQEKGPLIIGIGGTHGNELAGVKALKTVLEMLVQEPSKNPSFVFKGKFVAIHGNIAAMKANKRFIDKDLNRNYSKTRLYNLEEPVFTEDREALEIIQFVKDEISAYNPQEVVIIDLHTTSSPGGIFTIVPNLKDCLELAKTLHAPVIQGMVTGVKGTTMNYFNSENLGVHTKTLTFESGQHDDPMSITIAIAAVIALLRGVKSVEPHDVESHHDQILKNFSKDLPKMTKLVMKHTIIDPASFNMLPGYLNFQKVKKGEIVANNRFGPIRIVEDGLLLMPLYQKQGEDGFFLIKKIDEDEFYQ
ncbi:M14 family metallopeptidase [Portibacter lacus]|uniref:Succinylglutamate desuccinylase/Aspartoacylase catalytic domain-containing protein n=1 Tax=Portibacter lacus TaxID=1099794 RepID=A0AA37SQW0_9BACT|nr:succinylglutamate desuccinylase/aspartoacylase family protein [Portibacter lacus]GLR18983.1 hypothetical protein GCM10007940_35990 [Portibacter lacus]